MYNFNFVVGTTTVLCFIAALVYFLRASKKTEDSRSESVAAQHDPSDEPLVFTKKEGLSMAHKDGLVMVLVPNEVSLEFALRILSTEMNKYEPDEPGISGELFLDRDFGALNLSGWAGVRDLANYRMSLHLASGERSLEQEALERFQFYLDALDQMRTRGNVSVNKN